MPRSDKLRWTVRWLAVPLLLSLLLHGLLLLALWFCPTRRTPRPALSIAGTRITLDTRVLDPRTAVVSPDPVLPAELLGPVVSITLAPQLQEEPPISPAPPNSAKPARSSDGSAPPPATPSGAAAAGGASASGAGSGSLFPPVPTTAARVVYVFDRSVSMGMGRKLDLARREVLASLRRLPPSVRFQIIAYNDSAGALRMDGRLDWLPAEPRIIDKAAVLLSNLDASGGSNHVAALRCGLALRPDVLCFLTDADDLKREEVDAVSCCNRGSIVHAIEWTRRRSASPDGPLAQLARDNGGTYRCVCLSSD